MFVYTCFQIEELNAEIKDKVENQQKLEEERKEQIALIKKVNAVIWFISEKKPSFCGVCHLSSINV